MGSGRPLPRTETGIEREGFDEGAAATDRTKKEETSKSKESKAMRHFWNTCLHVESELRCTTAAPPHAGRIVGSLNPFTSARCMMLASFAFAYTPTRTHDTGHPQHVYIYIYVKNK